MLTPKMAIEILTEDSALWREVMAGKYDLIKQWTT